MVLQGGVDFIVDNFSDFVPCAAEVGQYFEAAGPNYEGDWKLIGFKLLKIFDSSIVRASEYLQVMILSLYERVNKMNHVQKLTSMYDQTSSIMCKRKIILAASKMKSTTWLSALKSTYKNSDPWSRRALIYAMRALPQDERTFWARSASKRTKGLDALILSEIR